MIWGVIRRYCRKITRKVRLEVEDDEGEFLKNWQELLTTGEKIV